jgi:hypothetical protein
LSRSVLVLTLALIGGSGLLAWQLLEGEVRMAPSPSGHASAQPAAPAEAAAEDAADPGPAIAIPPPPPERPREGAISGFVEDRGRIRLDHARVKVVLYTPKGERNYALVDRFEARLEVDEEGRFSTEVPAGGWYRVTAEAEGFAPAITERVQPGARLALRLDVGSGLSGVVHVAGSATPVAEVQIRARTPTGSYDRETVTDSAGRFAFPDLPHGLLLLDLVCANYVSRLGIEQEIRVGEHHDLRLELDPGKRIRASIRSAADDLPIAGAQIRSGNSSARTDDMGRATLRGLAAEGHRLQITARGFLPGERNVNLSGSREEAEVEIRLSAGATIYGVVTDDRSDPVTGAKIKLFASWGGRHLYEDWDCRHLEAESDADGRYELAGVPPRPWGRYAVRARHPDHPDAIARDILIRKPEDRAVADVVMRGGGSIAGRIADEEREPISGARVALHSTTAQEWSQGPDAGRIAVTGSDAEGGFSFGGLPEGQYHLRVEAAGYSSGVASRLEVIGNGGPQNVEVVLERGRPVGGLVTTEDDLPLGGVLVKLRTRRGRGEAVSDDTGHFEIPSISEGPYRASATLEGYAPFSGRNLVPDGDDLIRIRLRPQAMVRGQVIDATTEEPVRRFSVVLSREDPRRQGRRQRVVRRSVDDREGRFTIQASDDTYRLEVFAKGYVRHLDDAVRLETGQDAEPLLIRLRPGGAIEGYVSGEGGQPLAGATVYLCRRRDEEGLFRRAGRTEQDGYFFAGDLDATDHDVVIQASNLPLWIQEGVRVGGELPTRLDAALQPFCRLSIHAEVRDEGKDQRARAGNRHISSPWRSRNRIELLVESLDQQPVALSQVRRGSTGSLYGIREQRKVRIRSGTPHVITDLTPGLYRVRLAPRGYPPEVRTLNIDWGSDLRLDFTFSREAKPGGEAPTSTATER